MTKIAESFTQFVVEQENAPWWFSNPDNNRIVTTLITLPADIAAQAMVDGAKAAMGFRDHDKNKDFLPLLSETSNDLAQYPKESTSDYRERLARRWQVWVEAGSPAELIRECAAAGYPDCMVQRDFGSHLTDGFHGNPGFSGSVSGRTEDVTTITPNPYSFVLVVPVTVTSSLDTTMTWGSFNWGQTNPNAVYGYASNYINWGDLNTLRSIVARFKPVDFVCSAIVILSPYISNTSYLPNPAMKLDSESLWRMYGSPYNEDFELWTASRSG